VPLANLPFDPEPTEADVEPYLRFAGRIRDEKARYRTARLKWKIQKTQEDPNAFHVPFVPSDVDYKIYLSSTLWRRIRKAVLSHSNWSCAGCAAEATQVHHRDYRPRVLLGLDLTPLVALCADCHTFIHEWEDGKPKSWNEEDDILIALVADYEASAI
jgi:hypothetical protein